MAAPYILARTLRDAHEFAREVLGLPRGKYRVVTSPSTLSGRRGTDLYLVPGYQNRHDRFAMRGALRYTRLNVIDVEAEAPDGLTPLGTQPELTEGAYPALVAEFEAFLNGSGEHPHEQTEESEAHEFVTENPFVEVDGVLTVHGPAADAIAASGYPNDEHTHEIALRYNALRDSGMQAEEPAADETKRRRRRCKECGILVEPDEVEQHAAEHLPTEQ